MVESLKRQVRTLLAQGEDEKAYGLIGQILAKDGAHAEAYYLLGVIAHKYKSYDKEIEVLYQAERLAPENKAYSIYLARALAISGASSLAWKRIQAIDPRQLQSAELIDALAVTFNRLSLYERALAGYESLIELDDTNANTWFNLGTCYKYCGRFHDAYQALLRAVQLRPDYYKAKAALCALDGVKQDDEAVPELKALLSQADDVDAKLHLAHALSREYEKRKQYHNAFETLAAHKTAMRASLRYDFSQDERIFASISETPTPEFRPEVSRLKNLFVVGMPRTGTTLVERILSSVPEVNSGGELYHFTRALQRGSRSTTSAFATPEAVAFRDSRVLKEAGQIYTTETAYLHDDGRILLDKLPLNVLFTSQILGALEGALVICLDRNPLDTITGNYRQLFSFDDRANAYSLSLSDTARYYARFIETLRRFQKIYPKRFHVVNYERLVTHPESEARRLMAFCGFPWNSQCLSVEANPLPVATASSVQVRNSINAHSVNRWKRYDNFLSGAKKVLSEHNIAWEDISPIG